MQGANRDRVFPISALTGEGVADLLSAVATLLSAPRTEAVLHLAFTEGRARARLHDMGVVVEEAMEENGHRLTVRWTPRQEAEWRSG